MCCVSMTSQRLDKFDFEYQPVGFKFFNTKPEVPGLEKLDKKLAWCQMLPEAQSGSAFYAEADNHYCEPGVFLPGHAACDPIAGGGRIGPPFHIYPDERANRRVYDSLSLLAVGSVHSTAFAPLSKLDLRPGPSDPDLRQHGSDRARPACDRRRTAPLNRLAGRAPRRLAAAPQGRPLGSRGLLRR